MRKIFATLKSVVAAALVVSMTLAVSCSYDDAAVKNDINNLKSDLAALTERVNALENNDSISDLLDGAAVITDVTVNETTGDTVITLSNGKTVTVLAKGLQYRVTDGVLEISADGQAWVAVAAAPEAVVKSVVDNEDGTVTITLANDEEFTVAKAELIECEATRTGVYVVPETTKAVRFTINDAVVDINVMNQPLGWSATVEEYVEVEDDDLGGGVMPLAAGGKEYVLNITGPAKDFAQAAKEGVVSVHFNTAAGACKVLTVNVTLAELTLNVDANGNITIVNTIAFEQENYWGEKFTDFADFWIGVMPKALYEQNGDKTLVNDFDDWAYEYLSCATTQRSSGLSNILELQQYEEGVYEKEVLEFSVEQLAGAFWPSYNFELGESYVIFLSLDAEMVDYVTHPVLTNAIMTEYTKVLVDAQVVEGSEKWNDVTVNFNLAGFDYFSVGWLSVAEVEEYLSYGMYASAEEFIAEYINAYGVMSAGALLAGDHLDATYNLSELASMSMTEWAPELLVDTEYYFYVYPFNAKDQMEIYQHNFVAENLRIYGTFATAGLVAGEFEAGAEFEVVSHDEKAINVNVTFAEDVKAVMYGWYSEAFLDPEEAVADLMDPYNYYAETVTFDEYTTYLEASKSDYYGIDNPITLVMLAINSNGEYVVIQQEFLYVEPQLPQVEITSFEYVARSYELDDNPDTGGGDFVYDITCANGETFRLGLYYTYADAATGAILNGTYNYCYNALNAMYGGWDGFVIVSETSYNDSKLTVTDDQIVLKLKGIAEYVFNKNAAPVEPEQPEVFEPFATAALVTDTTFNGFNPYDVTFGFENGDQVAVRFNTLGAQYLHLGAWQTDNWQDPHYISQVKYNGELATITACNVAYENDAYTVTMSVFEYTNYNTFEYTYTGAIEGLIAPEACDCLTPEQPEGGEGDVINVTILNLTVGYDKAGEKELQFWFSATNAHVIDFKGFDNCNPGQPLAPGTYSSANYTIDAGYSIFDYGTTNGKMSSVECVVTLNADGTYTYDAKFTYDGQNYAFVYTGAYPAE